MKLLDALSPKQQTDFFSLPAWSENPARLESTSDAIDEEVRIAAAERARLKRYQDPAADWGTPPPTEDESIAARLALPAAEERFWRARAAQLRVHQDEDARDARLRADLKTQEADSAVRESVQRFHVALERLVANEYQDLVRTVHQAERVIGRQDYCHEVLWAALDAVAWRKDRLRAVGLL